MIKFLWIPKEVWYYAVFPILGILIIYLIFYLFYRRKKETYYYNYIVDYVYSTLGIIFCGLLLCLLSGYSIATLQILNTNNMIQKYIFLSIVLFILPFIPTVFLIYVICIFIKNIKRKEILDKKINIEHNENYSSDIIENKNQNTKTNKNYDNEVNINKENINVENVINNYNENVELKKKSKLETLDNNSNNVSLKEDDFEPKLKVNNNDYDENVPRKKINENYRNNNKNY